MTDRKHSWKKKAGVGALALAVAGVLGAGAAFARPPGHHGGPGGRGGHGSCGGYERLSDKIDDLGLDAEKQAAADQVLEQARAARKAQRAEMRAAREQMRALLAQDAPAVEAVMAQADAIGALETKAHKERLQTMLSLRSIVGAERWKELGFGPGAKRGFGPGAKHGPHEDGGRS
jgi:Spy/CpxP family protein refolding chaperone